MKTSITTITRKFRQLLLFIIFIFVSGVASGQDMISTPTQMGTYTYYTNDILGLKKKIEENNEWIAFYKGQIKKYQAKIEKLKATLKDGFTVEESVYYDPITGIISSDSRRRPLDKYDIYNIQLNIKTLEKDIKEAEKKIRELGWENDVLRLKIELLGTPNGIIGSDGSLSSATSDGTLQYVSVSIPDSLVFENTSGPEDSLSSASTTEEDNLDLLVFPQPAEQGALIQLNWPAQEEEFHLVILDPYGTTIETKDFPIGESSFAVDTHQWLSGFYHLLMYSETETITRKILIE